MKHFGKARAKNEKTKISESLIIWPGTLLNKILTKKIPENFLENLWKQGYLKRKMASGRLLT